MLTPTPNPSPNPSPSPSPNPDPIPNQVQREGASDPRQHGRTAPLLLPKKELGRFLQVNTNLTRTNPYATGKQ